jgi:hypothetical protein
MLFKFLISYVAIWYPGCLRRCMEPEPISRKITKIIHKKSGMLERLD